MTDQNKELIVGIKKEALLEYIPLEEGLNAMSSEDFKDILKTFYRSGDLVVQERSKIEKNKDILQLISYVAVSENIIDKDEPRRYNVGVYKRKDKIGEQRLLGKYSIGVGGHVELKDFSVLPLDMRQVGLEEFVHGFRESYPLNKLIDAFDINTILDPISYSIQRELDEELVGGTNYIAQVIFQGLILDTSNAVGEVHIGIAAIAIRKSGHLVPFGMAEDGLETLDTAADPVALSSIPDVYEKFENWSKVFIDHLAAGNGFLSDSEMKKPDALEIATEPTRPPLHDGLVIVPKIPTEAQWNGLARDIMMAWDCQCDTPRKLFHHLERSGKTVPQWLRDEPEMKNLDHVPSKGTRVSIIYRAMVEDFQATVPVSPSLTDEDKMHGYSWPTEINARPCSKEN